MSYILDALRKSEQERMRGKMPDLNHFGEEDKRSGRSHRWMWLVGGGLLLVNIAAVTVWLTRGDAGATSPVAAASAEKPPAIAPAANQYGTQNAAAQAPAVVSTPAGVASSTQAGAGQAVANAAGATSMAPSSVAQTSVPAAATAAPGTVITTAPPQGTVYYVAPAGTVPGQQIVVLPGGVMPAGVAPGSNVVVQVPAGSQPVTQAWPSGPNQVVAPPPPVPPPPDPVNLDQTLDAVGVNATPAVSYLPQLDELPPQLRQQIPDMSFSSHMYSSMQRFRSVVINGNRVREGEMVGNNIQVREITETGVILSIGDTQFQVDVLGKWAQ